MVSGLDRSGGLRSSLRSLPFSTVLFSGPFCSIAKNLTCEEVVRADHSRLTVASLESPDEKGLSFPTSVYLIEVNPRGF